MNANSPNEQIDRYIASLPDRQRDNLLHFRKLIHAFEPTIQEGWKWDVPVFLLNGKLVCAMSAFKEHIKFNFFEGAALKDTHKLFNSGLDSKRHRSINLSPGQVIPAQQIGDLVEEALGQARS